MSHQIHFIGTSHVSKESAIEIEKYIESESPDIVCVELDKQRLKALMSNAPTRITLKNISVIKQIGVTGFIFALVASYVQKKVGASLNTKPGKDMLTAVKIATKYQKKVALIDQDVNITLKKLSKEMKFREKMKIISDIIKGIFSKKSDLKEFGLENVDLRKVPQDELVNKIIEKTKDRYPSFHKVLVSDRNKFMIEKIFRIRALNPDQKLLIVIGAGHKAEMEKLLSKKLKKFDDGKIDVIKYNTSYNIG